MDFTNYIKPELLVLVPVLYIIGVGLKKSQLHDKFIPLVLGGLGVVLAALYILSVEPVNGAQAIATAFFTAITQGILCAGTSVYANQIYKQLTEKDEEETNGNV